MEMGGGGQRGRRRGTGGGLVQKLSAVGWVLEPHEQGASLWEAAEA